MPREAPANAPIDLDAVVELLERTPNLRAREIATALGLDAGVLAPGRLADLVVVDPRSLPAWGGGHPAGALVYALGAGAIEQVWIGGELVVEAGQIAAWPLHETIAGAEAALSRVRRRAGL